MPVAVVVVVLLPLLEMQTSERERDACGTREFFSRMLLLPARGFGWLVPSVFVLLERSRGVERTKDRPNLTTMILEEPLRLMDFLDAGNRASPSRGCHVVRHSLDSVE